jgi:hypothetical protein
VISGRFDVDTPARMMREQASLLGRKTENVVEATVDTTTNRGDFVHSFDLVVPALDHYTYELFRIRHGVDLYPVYVDSPSFKQVELKTKDAFKAWLQERLSSPDTKRIVVSLVAQAKG